MLHRLHRLLRELPWRQGSRPCLLLQQPVLCRQQSCQVAASDLHQRPFPSLTSLASLQQVWDLRNNGINGRPSLISLEEASKNQWRKGRSAKETQNYNKQYAMQACCHSCQPDCARVP